MLGCPEGLAQVVKGWGGYVRFKFKSQWRQNLPIKKIKKQKNGNVGL